MSITCDLKKGYFSLQEILAGNEDWEKALAKRVWDKHIKSSPLWGKFCNVNDRMEKIESRLGKIENRLDDIVICLNGRLQK